MSGRLVGAVLRHGPRSTGPRSEMRRWALVCLAHNADEFGFAQMRIDTLAFELEREAKQTARYLRALIAEGWLMRVPKAVEGCGNVYFLNLRKLSFETRPNALKSPLHKAFLDAAGRKWTGPTFPQAAVQNPLSTTDIPQGGQRTFGGGTPDISGGDTGHLGVPNKEAPVLRFSVIPGGSTGDDDGEEENFLSAVVEAALELPAVDLDFPSGVWRPPEAVPRRRHVARMTCRGRPRSRAG